MFRNLLLLLALGKAAALATAAQHAATTLQVRRHAPHGFSTVRAHAKSAMRQPSLPQ